VDEPVSHSLLMSFFHQEWDRTQIALRRWGIQTGPRTCQPPRWFLHCLEERVL